MRILCVSIDLPGHLDWGGYLATASLLAAQGERVVWASGAAVEATVRATGVEFIRLAQTGWQHTLPPLPAGLSPQRREAARQRRALEVWLSPQAVLAAVAELEDVIARVKPEVILAEPFAAAGVLAAEKLGLPLVVVGRPALPPVGGASSAAPAIERLCEDAGAPGAYWDLARGMPRSPHLHLDFFCRGWYADLPEVAAQTVFCGGVRVAGQPIPLELPSPRPLVLVTLGTTYADDETFYRLAAEGAGMVGAQALVVTGRNAPHVLESLRQAPPGRATVREWIDYAAVFPHLAAIAHHGGVATTHAALVHGVPQAVAPHAGDQYPQAARVTQAQVGYGIRPHDFNHHTAALILSDVVHLPEFRARAGELAGEMQALGGVETAARTIRGLAG